MNSYAFHSRSLINTLMTVLPLGVDKRYVEKIFLDLSNNENDINHIHSEMTDKIRKRVLLSANYSTAYKTKHVIEIFEELDRASDTLMLKLLKVKPSIPSIQKKFRHSIDLTLTSLRSRYAPYLSEKVVNGVTYDVI